MHDCMIYMTCAPCYWKCIMLLLSLLLFHVLSLRESDCDWQWDGPSQVPFSSIRGFSACFDSCALSTAKKQCHRKTYQFVRCCVLSNMHDFNSSAQLETRPYPEVECLKFAGTAHCNNSVTWQRMTSSSWDLTLPSRMYYQSALFWRKCFLQWSSKFRLALTLSYSNPAWSWHSNRRLRSGKNYHPKVTQGESSISSKGANVSSFHISWSKPLSLRQ